MRVDSEQREVRSASNINSRRAGRAAGSKPLRLVLQVKQLLHCLDDFVLPVPPAPPTYMRRGSGFAYSPGSLSAAISAIRTSAMMKNAIAWRSLSLWARQTASGVASRGRNSAGSGSRGARLPSKGDCLPSSPPMSASRMSSIISSSAVPNLRCSTCSDNLSKCLRLSST